MPRKRATKKRAAKKSKGRRGRVADLVAVQVSVVLTRKLKAGYTLSKSVLEEAVRRKADASGGVYKNGAVIGAREGPDPKGMKLKIIRWKNPARGGRKGGWRSGSQADAWGSLRGLLRRAKITFR